MGKENKSIDKSMAKMIVQGNKYVPLLKLLVGNWYISIQRLHYILKVKNGRE
jgi:hypothetical protein